MDSVLAIIGAYPSGQLLSRGRAEFYKLEGSPCHLLRCGCCWQSWSSLSCSRSVLYKRTFTPHELALTGVMAALSFAAYLFFRVPFYGGSSFHLGNTFTALAALLMDGVSGGLAGAIGLALADVLAGDPGYAITTFVLKFIIGVVCGLTAHRLCRIDTADPARRLPYVLRVTASAGSGLWSTSSPTAAGLFPQRLHFRAGLFGGPGPGRGGRRRHAGEQPGLHRLRGAAVPGRPSRVGPRRPAAPPRAQGQRPSGQKA